MTTFARPTYLFIVSLGGLLERDFTDAGPSPPKNGLGSAPNWATKYSPASTDAPHSMTSSGLVHGRGHPPADHRRGRIRPHLHHGQERLDAVALADRDVAEQIEDTTTHSAVVATLTWLENEVRFTRRGRGGIQQVKANGLIAGIFTDRDARLRHPPPHPRHGQQQGPRRLMLTGSPPKFHEVGTTSPGPLPPLGSRFEVARNVPFQVVLVTRTRSVIAVGHPGESTGASRTTRPSGEHAK